MPVKEEMQRVRLRYIVESLNDAIFPKYLKSIRKALGYSRKQVYEFTLIPFQRIQYLEEGNFKRMPEEIELIQIADLYLLPFDLLKDKAQKYLSTREC